MAGPAEGPHVPVLLRPLLAAVAPVSGVWVDGTFGAGGYARGLLDAGADRVIGIDGSGTPDQARAQVAELMGTHQETLRSAIDRVFADWAVAELGLAEASARQWVEMFSQAVLSVLQGWVVQSALLPGFDHEAYLDYARTLVASDEG